MRHWLLIFITLLLLSACSPAITPPDTTVTEPPADQVPPLPTDMDMYSPQPGDSKLLRGNVYLNSSQLLILESYPPQIYLELVGNLPDPCHRLRVNISAATAENRILVEVYSLADSSAICIQVLAPFNVSIPLGSFPAGHYSVWVNGELAGEFDY